MTGFDPLPFQVMHRTTTPEGIRRGLRPIATVTAQDVYDGVDVRYVQNSDRGIGLEFGTYDRNLPLVIDPILTVEIRKP